MTTALAGTLLAMIAFTATVALIAAAAYIGYLRNKMSAQLWALDYMQEVYDLQTQESLKTCDDLEAAYDRIVELSKVWHGTPSEEYDKLLTNFEQLCSVNDKLVTEHNKLLEDIEQLCALNVQLLADYGELDTGYGDQASYLAKVMHRNDQLERELSQLRSRDEDLEAANARIEEHSKDISWYGPLWEQYDKLLADYDQLERELSQLRG